MDAGQLAHVFLKNFFFIDPHTNLSLLISLAFEQTTYISTHVSYGIYLGYFN